MPPHSRFHDEAARRMRAAIADAGGVEIFAIGDVDAEGLVTDVEVHCRGTEDAVPALLSRPRSGQVVIHNHPSGDLRPSEADMHLANRYGEDGVGVVIVDSDVKRATWVVEPAKKALRPIDLEVLDRIFEVALPAALSDHEPRPGQLQMAREVAHALNEGKIALLEAGTGTGKSLAYLAPAVLWALANETRVAVATYTLTLQAQLATSDIPLLRRAGLSFEHAVLQGRRNYVCRRKLAEALAELPEGQEDEGGRAVRAIGEWAESAAAGTRGDMAFPVDEDSWDLVASDHDQTLRARCPHFQRCFYYEARRQAARAQVVVVNHHLLLADLAVKKETGGDGILPRFDRAVIDEGHHLEDAATSLFQERLTALSVLRTVGPLLDRGRRRGALRHVKEELLGKGGPMPAIRAQSATALIDLLIRRLDALRDDIKGFMEQLAADAGVSEGGTRRVDAAQIATRDWVDLLAPTIRDAGAELASASDDLGRLQGILADLPEDARLRHAQRLFDLGRGQRRLGEQAALCAAFATASGSDADRVRWIGRAGGRQPSAALEQAPIEVGPLLRERLVAGLAAIAVSSATLTVGKSFAHFEERTGLRGDGGGPDDSAAEGRVTTAILPSPFDYHRQALLGLPRDLPPPDDPAFLDRASEVIAAAIQAVGGGVFVLCTSYRMLEGLHSRVRGRLGPRARLFKQGEMGRALLLERFRADGDAVLFGTDSFWEGVSVKGQALRLVIIPRLPFRVPTEPVQQARYERLREQGKDPFRAYALPQAVLRFRQGFGRLIRTTRDRGAVVVLDRRMMQQWYGRIFLNSLPNMRRVTGPARQVIEALRQHQQEAEP